MKETAERIGKILPRPIVRGVRDIGLSILDFRDRLTGKADRLTPPRSLHFIGGGDAKAIGEKFLDHFRSQCGLLPGQSVLDIGCGTGRMAVPLLRYLNAEGSYDGFDICERAIAWCSRRITAVNPKFRFHFADIINSEYNPRGSLSAAEYRFPCEDGSVDFAFATSVFTHMFPKETKRYLEELCRVLKPNGQAMLTFFLLDKTAVGRMEASMAAFDFAVDLGDCRTIDRRTPERAIAVPLEGFENMLLSAGLRLLKPVFFGSWSGRESMLDGQDVVVVGRTGA